MRLALTAATGGAAAALAAGGILGVAGAESTGSSSTVRTISVGGVAQVPIAQGANAATANAVYRQALAAAIADGLNKAEYLAAHASATVGPVHSLSEGGGYIDCTGGGESYVAYEGEQPDFPNSPVGVVAPEAAAPAVGAPVPGRRLARAHRHRARKAAAGACTLHASVSLTYEIG